MYETYFHLSERPFASVPRTDHYFPAAMIEAARTTLLRSVDRAEGPAIVIGPPGTGKTLLCQLLAEHFRQPCRVALLGTGRLATRRALLQSILYELRQPYRGLDEEELRLGLSDQATLGEESVRPIVLLVDEAHNLPLRLLDELRTLTNLVREGQPAVRLVLFGGRGLEERLANPRLESFSQRLAVRCYLEAFDRGETQQYIEARLAAAGGSTPQIFPPETCQSVHKATDGVPRLINQVCDHAMMLACAAGVTQIEPAHLEEAWADLQQLPTPFSEPAQDAAPGIIEFGGLDDEPAEDEPRGERAADAPPHLLRISPHTEGCEQAETDDLGPDAQIGRIQEILAEVKEDLEPAIAAATAEAEAELEPALAALPQPVGETAADAAAEPSLVDLPQPVDEMLAEPEAEPSPAELSQPLRETLAEAEADLSPDAADNPFRETFAEEEVVVDRCVPAQVSRAWPQPAACKTRAPIRSSAALGRSPRALPIPTTMLRTVPESPIPVPETAIAVDDDPADTAWPTTTIAAVERQQFAGLFAKLRQRS
jgi:type II secretory pathway predicted ATPase ExeA